MASLIVRYCVPPAIVGVVTLIARRQGPLAGGWWGSLPVTAGPILLIVTIDHGAGFGETAAKGALLSVLGVVAFITVYAWLAVTRAWGWCLLVGWGAFAASAMVFLRLPVPLVPSIVLVVVAILAGQRIVGRPDPRVYVGARLPADLALRMGTAFVGVGIITGLARVLGPVVSGFLASFPLIASVMSAFIHAADGPASARAYAVGLLRGLPSLAAFTFCLAAWLAPLGTAAGFALATGVALSSHGVLMALTTHQARQAPFRISEKALPDSESVG
jgi:hypothetical protein